MGTSVRPRPRLIPLSSTPPVSTLPTPMASTTTPSATTLTPTPPPTPTITATASVRLRPSPGPCMAAPTPMAASMVATGDGTRRQTNAWTTDLDYDNDI